MHDVVLEQILKGDNKLDGKALGQGYGESLEVVVLDELVQIDTQHFKTYTL